MQASKIVGYGAVAAAVIATVVVVAVDRDERVTKDGAVALITEAKVDWLPDGTKVYRVPVQIRDGGIEEVVSTEAPCKRRPKGAKNCERTYVDEKGVEVTHEAPELARFPASTMSGADCEPVACSVFLGQDPDAPEVRK